MILTRQYMQVIQQGEILLYENLTFTPRAIPSKNRIGI